MNRSMQTLAAAAVLTLTSACASSGDRPVEQLARAEAGVELAEQNGAREHAVVSLDQARDKLANAKRAADRGDHRVALRLAKEAEIDAEFAAAQASRGRAESSLAEINDSIDALRDEIARSSNQ